MNNKGQEAILAIGFLTFVIVVFGFITMTASVPAGNIGVQDTFGSVSGDALNPGFYVKAPWTWIVPMSIQTQKYSAKAAAASRDLQDVSTEVTLNFHLKSDAVILTYKTIGRDYSDKVIIPAVQESVKATTAQFTASELITERPRVKVAIEQSLSDRLSKYNIAVETVSITDFVFSEQFTKSIEAKVTAEQDAFRAENDLKRIKVEKEQIITKAQADANAVMLAADASAYKIHVEADAQAYQLKVITEQLEKSNELVPYKIVEKWNGVLPVYASSSNPITALPLEVK